jgi:uncharacterized protein (DUF736 family)
MASRQIGALWKKKSQTGTQYMSGMVSMGVFGECPVVVFAAMEKRSEQSPDFIIYASTPQRQNGQATDADAAVKGDDDLPF